MQRHEQRWHAIISEVTKRVNTVSCAVCGLTFESVAMNRRRSRESPLCKHNLLLRGPVIEGEALSISLDEDATFKTTNGKSGKSTMKRSGCCVRALGPHRIIYDEAGNVVLP